MKRIRFSAPNLLIFIIIMYGYVIQYTFMPKIISYLLIAIAAICGIRSIFSLNINIEKVPAYLFLVILSVLMTFLSKAPHFIFAFFIAIACIKAKKSNTSIVRSFFLISLFFFVLTIGLYLVGILPNNAIYRLADSTLVARSSLGFDNPNTAMLYVLPIFAAGYYLYGSRIRYYLVSLLMLGLLYYTTDSRTGVICILLFTIAAIFLSRWKKVTKTQSIIFASLFVVLTIVSLALAGSPIAAEQTSGLNILLSNRPYFWSYYTNNQLTLSFLGGEKVPGYILDNMYIFILVKMGIFAFISYASVYFIGVKRMINDHRMLIIVAIYLIYGVLETSVIITSINFVLPILIKSIIEKWTEKPKIQQLSIDNKAIA